MFCDKCGTKFIEINQRFCQKCGTVNKTTTTTSQSGSQLTIMNTQSSSQIPKRDSGYQLKSTIPRKIGIHSKRSLAFGITSLISSTFVNIYYSGPSPINFSIYMYDFVIVFLIGISLLVSIVFGLVFGILARSNGNKAEKLESTNKMQKMGSVMGLIGIIFVSIVIGNIALYDTLMFTGIYRYI
ncbi:MAG: zinc ribbon domain-containing protein [Promethearchaeota archaeon]